jgi:hypothetical protein
MAHRDDEEWRNAQAALPSLPDAGLTFEQAAEPESYLQAAAPARGSPAHYKAIRDLIDQFHKGEAPSSTVGPAAIGALGDVSPIDRLKASDAALAMAVARHRRSELDTPTDIAIMFFIKVFSDNNFGRCTQPLSRMAAFANVDVRTVQRRLRALKDAGLIDEEPRSGKPTAYWLIFDAPAIIGSAFDVICAIAPSTKRPPGRPSKIPNFMEMGRQLGPPRYQNGATINAIPLREKGRHSEKKGAALNGKRGDNGCRPAPTLAPATKAPTRARANDALAATAPPASSDQAPTQESSDKRKTPLPANWAPTPEQRQWVVERYLASDSQIDRQVEKFVDYHRQKGSLMVDWPAAWRNWWHHDDFHKIPRRNSGGMVSVGRSKTPSYLQRF